MFLRAFNFRHENHAQVTNIPPLEKQGACALQGMNFNHRLLAEHSSRQERLSLLMTCATLAPILGSGKEMMRLGITPSLQNSVSETDTASLVLPTPIRQFGDVSMRLWRMS